MARPVIAIKAGRPFPDDPRYIKIRPQYPAAVSAAGGIPVLVPQLDDEGDMRRLVSLADGLFWPGGMQPGWEVTELQLLTWSLTQDMPLLFVCRGHQLLNVALGGSMSKLEGAAMPTSHWQQVPPSQPCHSVEVDATSRLARILGVRSLDVSSYHNWELNSLGAGLRAVAWSPDGVVEAIDKPDHGWLVSVQWHPEDFIGTQEPSRRVFEAFVAACRRRARRGKAA